MKPRKKAASEEERSEPLWIAARTLLAGTDKEFFSCWKKVVKGYQEDDIHDLRVASRRLREGLALFAPCFPAKKTKRLTKEVKKLTAMLGELRNTDESFRFFSGLSAEESEGCAIEVEELLAALRSEREAGYRELEKELGALDPAPLRADLAALNDQPELFGKGEVDPFMEVTLFAGGAIMERDRPVADLLPEATREENSVAQHRLRIAVKKLRYRIEILAPYFRKAYEELREELKGYQDVLGKLHDVDVFTGMVLERVAPGTGRERLLQVMKLRRKELYDSFLKMLKRSPVDAIGQRAKESL